ncbi:hypothetical protein [Micrococcus sp.]|uniref:hypothetical protein n=1 Tax=Micrococcus sp. TaxID=1271 RepID=UPI002A91184F|nr:hypothetical protein [Micrococcus sp.]MDY6055034.1 hypothetical protein [Micrococcus sp.]
MSTVTPPQTFPAPASPAAEQAAQDVECLTFFAGLVTAALTMLVLALGTDLTAMPRLLLALAATVLVCVVVHTVAAPAGTRG